MNLIVDEKVEVKTLQIGDIVAINWSGDDFSHYLVIKMGGRYNLVYLDGTQLSRLESDTLEKLLMDVKNELKRFKVYSKGKYQLKLVEKEG